MVGILCVHRSILECRVSHPHQIVQNDAGLHDDSDCLRVVLHRSAEDLPTLRQDAEGILNDSAPPRQSLLLRQLACPLQWFCPIFICIRNVIRAGHIIRHCRALHSGASIRSPVIHIGQSVPLSRSKSSPVPGVVVYGK